MKSFFSREAIWFFVACCVLGGAYGLVSAYTHARSPEQIRKRALVAGHQACVDGARRSLAAAGTPLPDSTVEGYCTCAMGRALDAMTDQQVLDVDAGRTHTKDVLADKYPAILRTCLQESRSATGLPATPEAPAETPAGSPLPPGVPVQGAPAEAPAASPVRP